jgi:hypothetical protein
MKSATLMSLEQQLPQVFDRVRRPPDWPDNVIIVRSEIDDPLRDPLHEDLDGHDSSAPASPSETLPGHEDTTLERLRDVHSRLHDAFGADRFPGSPVLPDDWQLSPPPDCYAFYLPWHHFDERTWGIYLLLDGIYAMGQEIVSLSQGVLSLAQGRHIAKIFLYHHEAYHNAVESFSARLEVTHRTRCYVGGFRQRYQRLTRLPDIHEEALANAYAAHKVKRNSFAMVTPTNARTRLRRAGFDALARLMARQPPPYADAQFILTTYEHWERRFQEQLHMPALLHNCRHSEIRYGTHFPMRFTRHCLVMAPLTM